ncbi:MAG: threonine--tRNA ligase [Bacteroidota bacterium]
MAEQINITLPDGSVHQKAVGVTAAEIAAGISGRLAREALAARVNDEVWDLGRPITTDATVAILTWNEEDGKKAYWHSSAHLLAEALEALYPGVKFGIGPAIEKGFYYDVDLGDRKLSQEDLTDIENKMRELAKRNVPFTRRDVSKEEAIAYFKEKGDEYKLELIDELDGDITFYEQGDFTDLCRGPHIPATGVIKNPKILNIAGAYWRGDSDRPQLTRLYGITFPKKKELDEYLERLEMARQRDHRKLGRELELFKFSQKVGPGLPLWLPKGALLRDTLVDFLKKKQVARGYQTVITPHIGRLELYKTSGHYPYYKDSQFPPMIEDEEANEGYLLKPMNCPHHVMIYGDRLRSYRELPVRLTEFGQVYRYEQSGEMGGLTRVRGFTIDDSHLFCRPDQVKAEFKDAIELTLSLFTALGFDSYKAQVSLRDPNNKEKYTGDDALWDQAEQAIREAAVEMGLDITEEEGEAAFYGPKLDFMVKDALGRDWQLGTVQLDYNLPERFDLTYIGEDNEKHRPVMIHRAALGSLERFIGVLIEHCGGNFPTWLSPVQVTVLPIAQDLFDYAETIKSKLMKAGLRTECDFRNEKIGRKIRDAETQKTPYMLVLGKRELEENTVAVRQHGKGAQETVSLDAFIERIQAEIDEAIGD